jgi:hypothetical protein
MKVTKAQLSSMIRESLTNALSSGEAGLYNPDNYDERGVARVTPEEKKGRLEGRKQAIAKFAGKSVEELQAAYLSIERKAEEAYQDTAKSAFLWGALDQIKKMLKQAGQGLPKKSRDPWTR